MPDEKFLVLINDLLASGEIPDLFAGVCVRVCACMHTAISETEAGPLERNYGIISAHMNAILGPTRHVFHIYAF